MHLNHTWSRATRPAQMLAMLVTTALVILGITSLPTFAAAPTLKLAINADEDSYLSGVEQRYVVEFFVRLHHRGLPGLGRDHLAAAHDHS